MTELEKNLNTLWDKSFNNYDFRVKGKGMMEAIYDFDSHRRKGQLVQACEIADDFLRKYILARRDDEHFKLLMKEYFNTLKAKLHTIKVIEAK